MRGLSATVIDASPKCNCSGPRGISQLGTE